MQAFLQMAERERARTKIKSVKIISVKSERIPEIIVKIVSVFLCTFAVENGEARLYLGKSRTSSALHSACTDFAARLARSLKWQDL